MDFDELINLEQEFYQQGFEYGQQEVFEETKLSGKMLGIQTGYQRFLLLGTICGIVEELKDNGEFEKCRGKLVDVDLDKLLQNDDASVEELDKCVKKLRNWVQMNCLNKRLDSKMPKLSALDSAVEEIVGKVQETSQEW